MSETLDAVSPKDAFLAQLVQPQTDVLSEEREAARKALETAEIPTTRWEDWKYTRVAKLFKQQYTQTAESAQIELASYKLPELNSHKLVFVDGVFRPELSSNEALEGVTVLPLSAALKQELPLLHKHFNKSANRLNDLFWDLNTAYANEGTVVHINVGHAPVTPIEFVIIAAQQQHAAQLRNLIVVESNAQAELVFNHCGHNGIALQNTVTEMVVGENAHVQCTVVQNNGPEAAHIHRTTIAQAANSAATVNTITLNGGLVRNDLRFEVNGQNCTSNLYGLYPTRGNQHVDNHTVVDHRVAHCESNEHYKGILNDKSTAVFNGKVYVRPDAQKTNAFQSNQNILLTDEADVNSKPELEIYADDVKCSHGSTTGQFDEEAVYYLRSRGITEDSARKLLIQAFAEDVLSNVQNETLREWLSEQVAAQFKQR